MDKFFMPEHDIPQLRQADLERMAEVAISYRQQPQAVTRDRNTFFAGWLGWRSAFSAAACVLLVVGVLAMQETAQVTDTRLVSGGDAYADITEIAILNTLDGY